MLKKIDTFRIMRTNVRIEVRQLSIEARITIALDHIHKTDPTEDEYIRSYLKGMEDALQLITGQRSESGARKHTA